MRTLTFILIFCLCQSSAFGQNNALSFDGTAEFITAPHNNNYNIGNTFTVEAWIFAETWKDQSWQGTIVAKDGHGTGNVERGFAFRCGANGTLSFVMGTTGGWEEAVSGQVMNTNQWHHVAATVNNGTILLYIDGQQAADHSFTGTANHSPDLELHIGSSAGFPDRFFDGVIDEIRVWNVARTQAEILNNSTVDLTGSEPGLMAYFPFNEGMGTTTADLSPTSANLTFNEMDESNWVEGYTIPEYDISVQTVYGIDVVNMIDRPVKMKVDLLNTGTEPISDISLTVSIDGQNYNTETVTNTINSGELFAYEFVLPIDLVGLTDPEVTVVASQADDGNSLNNSSTLSLKTGTNSKVIVSDQGFFNAGQQLNSFKMTLPNDLHRYEQMLLNIDLSCPAGGCGDWDVLADLKVLTDAGTFELARYITPYGVACGGWQVDITDFKSVLGGEVVFQPSVILFTQTGWLLDMSIDLIDNNPQDSYSTLSKLWEEGYHVYGDSDINDDLAPITVNVASNTETNHVRMTITGHGQGNTNNAAEFFEVTHNLNVGGSPFADHHLWKDDCSSNPCSPQSGNWQFPRAGWCPGQSVTPFVINTTSGTTPGSSIVMDYELQEYTNLLDTGYNNSSHTEPYYRLYSYFVENASTPYSDYRNLAANTVTGTGNANTIETAMVDLSNTGLEDLTNYTINIFYDNAIVATETFNETIAVGASAQKEIDVNVATTTSNTLFAEVVNSLDDNPGDNVTKTEIITSTNQLALDYKFEVFPNPTSDGLLFLQYDDFWKGSIVKIYHTNGSLANTMELENDTETIQLATKGVYWYTLVHPITGDSLSGKIVFVD